MRVLRDRSSGFTLVEVLIASLIVSVVLAMAMQGFTTSKRIADMTKSKAVAASEAAQGIKELTEIIRRASIVYYSGVPLTGTATGGLASTFSASPLTGLPTITGTDIPATYGGRPYGANQAASPTVKYSIANPTLSYAAISAFDVPRTRFRFQARGGGSGFMDSNAATGLLHSAVNSPPTAADCFPSPLLYCAEAIMENSLTNAAGTGAGAVKSSVGSMPKAWNIYVAYLAPMDITTETDPLLPVPGGSLPAQRDRGGEGAAKWVRSTIPFELRLLTVTNVAASIGGTAPLWGRRLYTEAGTGIQSIPPVPWEYGAGGSMCNYDPIMLAHDLNSQMLITAAGYTPFSPLTTHDTERIEGGQPHTNFGAMGNDPPTDAAIKNFSEGDITTNFSDRVIARYIDPDSPDGTFVRFVNPYQGGAIANPYLGGAAVALPGTARYVDTIEGGFQYNPAITLLPRRALLSVTTRYRTGRDIAFTFSTKSEEVSLEAAVNYQNGTMLRTRRM